MIIAVDFDGTIVQHRYPDIGPPVPHAMQYLRAFSRRGARLVLWTCRHDGLTTELSDARRWLEERGLAFSGFNSHPWKHANGPKINAHVFIDDHGFGVPLRRIGKRNRPFVDWRVVGPQVLKQLVEWNGAVR